MSDERRRNGQRLGTVRLRAVLLGLALVAVNAYWLQWAVWGGFLHTYISLFGNTVFCLFLLSLLNLLLERVWPRHALRPGEVLTIYVMTVMISTVSGNWTCFIASCTTW